MERGSQEGRGRVAQVCLAASACQRKTEISKYHTFMICVEDILVGVPQCELIGNRRLLSSILLSSAVWPVC